MNQHAIPEMHDYLSRIGYRPSDLNKLNVIHVTGTKGKGSTCAFTERILRSHLISTTSRTTEVDEVGNSGRAGGGRIREGERVKIGLYTSPHLCSVRERIRINGKPLEEEEFADYFFQVWEKLESNPKVNLYTSLLENLSRSLFV